MAAAIRDEGMEDILEGKKGKERKERRK